MIRPARRGLCIRVVDIARKLQSVPHVPKLGSRGPGYRAAGSHESPQAVVCVSNRNALVRIDDLFDKAVLAVVLECIRRNRGGRAADVPHFLDLGDIAVRVRGYRGDVIRQVRVLGNRRHVAHAAVIVPETTRRVIRPRNDQARAVAGAVIRVLVLIPRVHAFRHLFELQTVVDPIISHNITSLHSYYLSRNIFAYHRSHT